VAKKISLAGDGSAGRSNIDESGKAIMGLYMH
jgi:hypothetical protein